MDLKKPFGRVLKDFEPLMSGEQRLLDACKKGAIARLGDAMPEQATDAQRVRAAFVRFLLLGGDEQAPVHERGVYLEGAFVEGGLDLCGCRVGVRVGLIRCHFDQVINAIDAQFDGLLNLQGSRLSSGLNADRLRCSASVLLRNGFKATGEVRLPSSQIGGELDCNGGEFWGNRGDALFIDGALVKGDVHLSGGFKATGKVWLQGAQIGGELNCCGGSFEVKKDYALYADSVEVKGAVNLRDGFKATGEVRLMSAQIGGDLDCGGGQFEAKNGRALSVENAHIRGNVNLCDGFKAMSEVTLLGAQIGGSMNCEDGYFEQRGGDALSIDRMNIMGDVLLGEGFKAMGAVRLPGTQIGGSLTCNGGQFQVREGDALLIDGAEVKGDVFLNDGFKANGSVRLYGAQISGNLDCGDGQFEAREGDALLIDGAVVKGDVFLKDGFKATGAVCLNGAKIGGSLDCKGGQFEADEGLALSLESAVVRGTWFLHSLSQSACVNAAHADVAVLVDDLAAWAPGSVLDGLHYASFGDIASTNGATRLKWLRRQSEAQLGDTEGGIDFRPQPWRQLQRVLREMGHLEDAKEVGIAFQDRLRAIGRMGQWPNDICDVPRCFKGMVTRSTHYAFGKLAGYGYRTVDLVLWMFSVWLVCGAAYWWLALPPQSAIAPSDPLVFQDRRYQQCQPDQLDEAGKPGNWYLCSDLRSEYSTFSPFAFSLDLLLPVVDLGQEKAWGAFIPTPKESPWEEWFSRAGWHWGHAVRFLTWIQTLFGWVCSLLLVAIVSGYSRRNDEG